MQSCLYPLATAISRGISLYARAGQAGLPSPPPRFVIGCKGDDFVSSGTLASAPAEQAASSPLGSREIGERRRSVLSRRDGRRSVVAPRQNGSQLPTPGSSPSRRSAEIVEELVAGLGLAQGYVDSHLGELGLHGLRERQGLGEVRPRRPGDEQRQPFGRRAAGGEEAAGRVAVERGHVAGPGPSSAGGGWGRETPSGSCRTSGAMAKSRRFGARSKRRTKRHVSGSQAAQNRIGRS